MPAHVPVFMLSALCVRHHNGKWACKRIPSLSLSSPPLPLKKEANHLPCGSFVCHYTGAHVKTHVSSLQAVLHEGCFASWWEWELLDTKDHSVWRNSDSFLWSSCSLLKLSITLDNTMLHRAHKFSPPPANIFISCVCMPKILDFCTPPKANAFGSE